MEPSKPLIVPDAEELKDFVANAKEVWSRQHPDKQKPTGRPSDVRILEVMKDVLKDGPRNKIPTQYFLTERVQERFYDKDYLSKKFGSDTDKPSRDAIQKYAKLVLALIKWSKEDAKRSINDAGWISAKIPASPQVIAQVLDTVSAILPDLTKVIEGLDEIQRIVDLSGITMTEARRKTIQRVVLDFKTPPPQYK